MVLSAQRRGRRPLAVQPLGARRLTPVAAAAPALVRGSVSAGVDALTPPLLIPPFRNYWMI